jgi:hypothetical protein
MNESIIASQDDNWEENTAYDEPKKSTMNSPLDIESSTLTTATIVQDETSIPPNSSRNCCVKMWQYENIPEAKGYALLAMGRGVAVMSNGKNLRFSLYFVTSHSTHLNKIQLILLLLDRMFTIY